MSYCFLNAKMMDFVNAVKPTLIDMPENPDCIALLTNLLIIEISHVYLVSFGFYEDLEKDLAAGLADTECVNLKQNPKQADAASSCDISWDNTHNLPVCQQTSNGSIFPLRRKRLLTIAITPLLLSLPISLCHE